MEDALGLIVGSASLSEICFDICELRVAWLALFECTHKVVPSVDEEAFELRKEPILDPEAPELGFRDHPIPEIL